MPTAVRPIFAIFEGGGAKGIAHLGALKATEESGFEIIGVAGASAGSIIAALVAAGYRADDLLNPGANTHILTQLGRSPLDLLGRTDWTRFARFVRRGKWLATAVAIGGAGFGQIFPRLAAVVETIERDRGYLSTEGLRELVNDLVRRRLLDFYANAGRPADTLPGRVRFRDLDPGAFPQLRPLKIVATNLLTRQLFIFDRELTPDAEIGEAVAASAAIPFVFKPVTLQSHPGGPFVDGGLVSNLPIWLFVEEKLAFERANPTQPPVPIIGFTLNPATNGAAPPVPGDLAGFAATVMETGIFSGQSISQRFIEDLYIVPLTTALTTLDFDAPWPKICDAFHAGRRGAAERLRGTLQIKPERVRAELGRICDEMRRTIDAFRARTGRAPLPNLRANLCEKFGAGSVSATTDTYTSLRVTNAYNMAHDADDRLLLDRRGRGAPQAFLQKTAILVRLGPGAPAGHAAYMTKYERALLRPQMRAAICVPVFRDVATWGLQAGQRPEPLGVLCIDSDDDLSVEFADTGLMQHLAEESVTLSSAFGTE